MAWIEGASLASQKRVLVPADVALFGHAELPGLIPLLPTTSNGLACGPTLPFAIRSALYEVLERDAFVIAWLNKLSLPSISVEDLSLPWIRHFVDRYQSWGIDVSIKLTVNEFRVPSILAIAFSSNPATAASWVGGGAGATLAEAASKALFELEMCRPFAMNETLIADIIGVPFGKAKARKLSSFDDHAELYFYREMRPHIDFLLESGGDYRDFVDEVPGHQHASEQVGALVERLVNGGLDPLYVDLTSDDVREYSLSVVRVVVPGLQPLYVGQLPRYLGGSRLYHVPVALGLRQQPLDEAQLNPTPHPFP